MASVLIVLESAFPIRGGGGAESQVHAIGRQMVARGVRVRVVVPRVPNGPQSSRDTLDGIEIIRITYPRVPLLGGIVMLLKLALLMVGQRRSYEVVHAHIANNMAALACLVGGMLGKPVFVKLTGMKEMVGGILDERPNQAVRIKRAAIFRATLIQATSKRIRQLLIDRGLSPERARWLPNGVDVARFRAAHRDDSLRTHLCGDAQMVAVFVGRLAPEKGHELLFEAWARVFRADPSVRLVLVGDGVLRERFVARAEALGIAGQLVFVGHADRVEKYLAIADLGLITSFAEGLSNALLEYMATGLPVIGSRISGTEDFLTTDDTGWLFEAGSTDELALCLRSARQAGAERLRLMGQNARARVQESASLEAVTDRLMQAYGFDAAGLAASPESGHTGMRGA